jgi:N4-gp56 family major capsid protein
LPQGKANPEVFAVAETVVSAGDPAAVVIYSRRVFIQAIHTPVLAKLMAPGLNARDQTSIVQMFDEPMKGPGDTIKFDFLPQLTGPGVIGDAPIAGQESPLSWQVNSFTINQQRNAVLIVGRMSQQRIPWAMRDAAYAQLANWSKEILDAGLMNQAACNANQSNVAYTGLNAVPTFDTNHQILSGGAANEASLNSSQIMDLELLTEAIAKAQSTLIVPIKPPVLKGVEMGGIVFLHPTQVRDLKNNFQAGEWGNIFGMAMQGGQVTGNPIWTGAIGVYENVVMHSDARVPWGSSSQNQIMLPNGSLSAAPTVLGTTSVARGVFLGAQALSIAFGVADNVDSKPLRVRWYEEVLDGGNQLRVTGGFIWGSAQPQVTVGGTLSNYATILLSTYAAP